MCAADDFSRRHFMMYLLEMVPGHSENLGNIHPKIDTEFQFYFFPRVDFFIVLFLKC